MSHADDLGGLSPTALEKLRRGFPLHMDRQGNFWFEGDPLTHPGVVRLFRSALDVTELGEVIVGVDGKWVYLDLDDLPLRALRIDAGGEAGQGSTAPPPECARLLLDDGRCAELDPTTLWEEPDAGLRCTVPAQTSGRPIGVRLSNTAAVDLTAWMVWEQDDGRPLLQLGDQRWPIPDCAPS
jgi:hypothetical protein